MSTFPFCVEYDKRGQAGCKKCKQKITKGLCRIGKIVPNHFSDSGGDMKQWHHYECIFEVFKKARATTKIIEDPLDDLEGWENLEEDDKKRIKELIDELAQFRASKATPKKATPKKTTTPKATNSTPKANAGTPTPKANAGTPTPKKTPQKPKESTSSEAVKKATEYKGDPNHRDNSFREFRRVCANIADEPGYLNKTEILSRWLKKGSSGDGFEGDLCLWVRLLLPGVVKRVYNLQSKQLIKLFSQLFGTNQEEMLEDLEKGDIAETIRIFFEKSRILQPVKKACLSLHKVDALLSELANMSKEEEHSYVMKKMCQLSTANDLKMLIRIIKGDLRIFAGAKHILDAVHPDAYTAFQTTRNIEDVIDQVLTQSSSGGTSLRMSARVMTPVLPMLAEACKSVDYAFKKCPNGMYSEIKYDGERVQLHKIGDEFKYFSRSLKPVMPHKVSHFKEYIPHAFPNADDLILDAEVLLIDTKTGDPLPFGTLGKHKKEAFQDASVCLFIFDCLHMNDKSLMEKPIIERRRILESTMVEVKNHIMFSEYKVIKKKTDLADMIQHVLKQGLEGLVLKDLMSVYEPGKRHWLKVKKDYLNDGAMADTADLVVLGAWYGTGKKGGIMSVFLMGCHDPHSSKWCTVSKVSGGHDDAALARLQKELEMDKISQDPELVPSWLKCTKSMIPDFVAKDPKKSPVWEITGAEFTKNVTHTADGISIRFPRVTKERKDKSWNESTNLPYLHELYKKSKECTDIQAPIIPDNDDDDTGSNSASSTPRKVTPSKPSGRPFAQNSPAPSMWKAESPNTSKERVQKSLSGFFKEDKEERSPLKERDYKVEKKKYIKEENNGVNDKYSKMKKEIEKTGYSDKKGEKRKSDSDRSQSSKRKMCKHGSSCYNDNEAHRLMYFHPPQKEQKHPTTNPLPDVFTGVAVVLPDDTKDIELLKQYIIAFDGDVIPSYRIGEATHLVVNVKEPVSAKSSHCLRVTCDWLWDSIKLKKLQMTRPYQP